MASVRSELPELDPPAVEALTFLGMYLALAVVTVVRDFIPEFAFDFAGTVPDAVPGEPYLSSWWFWLALVLIGVGLVFVWVARTHQTLQPQRTWDVATVGIAVVAPVIIAVGLLAVVDFGLGQTVAGPAGLEAPGDPSLVYVLEWVLIPSLIIGTAYGILFYAAFQAQLRRVFDATASIASIAVLGGFYQHFIGPITTFIEFELIYLGLLVLVLAATALPVLVIRMDGARSLRSAFTLPRVIILLVAAYLLFGVSVNLLSGATTLAEVSYALAWTTSFGVGAVLFDRSDSAWPATLSLVVFQMSLFAILSVEAALGLA